MFSHFKSAMFQDNTPNEHCHLEGPWDVKLPTFEFVLFHLFPHLTLEGKRDFSSRFGFLLILKHFILSGEKIIIVRTPLFLGRYIIIVPSILIILCHLPVIMSKKYHNLPVKLVSCWLYRIYPCISRPFSKYKSSLRFIHRTQNRKKKELISSKLLFSQKTEKFNALIAFGKRNFLRKI